MSETKTITINGRQYDAHTGLMVEAHAAPASVEATKHVVKPARSVAATHVHARTERSKTLNRKTIKRPQAPTPAHTASSLHGIVLNKKPKAHDITPSPAQFPKFAAHPTTSKPATKRLMDIGPVQHPHVAKAHAISQVKADAPLPATPAQRPSAQHIKQAAINAAVENTHKQTKHASKPLLKRHPRAFSIVTASLALVLLGGYFTYLNMPSLSVRVAAAQAGINAGYPSYQPDGYGLSGLIGYSAGQVKMKFAANGGPQAYTITQTKSSWDSTAVLDNYITPRAGVSYIPYTERGLTIYTYGNNAAWVNGGILYTIEGNAPLSSEQIRHIATSLI